MQRSRSALYRSASTAGVLALATVLAFSAAPAGVAQTTLVDVTLANPSFNDFEDGAQGWSANPGGTPVRPAPTATWEWGVPTSGPNVAASGVNVWATNIDGPYAANECSGLATPAIDLTNASSASVSFKHWRHFEQLSATSSFVPDAGVMMATTDGGQTFTVLAASGYTTNSLSSVIRPCFDGADTLVRGFTGPAGTIVPGPTYTTSSADLSAFAGQSVQVVFVFASNCCNQRAGWYVDDVATTIDGVTSVQDFEANDGGFTQIGTKVAPPVAMGWGHGVPVGGPGEPTAMWATNPNGNYGPNECHWVESPPVDLGPLPAEAGVIVSATLSWNQWYRSSSVSAAGVVQIGTADGNYTIVEPSGGYPASPTSTVLDACLGHLAGGQGAFSGFIDPVGGPMTEFEADITPFLGQNVTIRYLFASTSSTITYPGWHVDDVNVETAIVAALPELDDVGPGGADAPLWTSGGDASSWAHGVATSGPVGETVYKTNLAGSHNARECSWIQSPAIPGAALGLAPTLKFDHWYKMESLFSTSTYDGGMVLVSVDEGATWTYLALPEYDRPMTTTMIRACAATYGIAPTAPVFSGNNSAAFESVVADLSAYAGASSLTVRFLFGSDSSVQYDGWAIKNVEIGGAKVL